MDYKEKIKILKAHFAEQDEASQDALEFAGEVIKQHVARRPGYSQGLGEQGKLELLYEIGRVLAKI